MKKIAIIAIVMSMGLSLIGCSSLTASQNKSEANFTIEQAKEIALKHANLTSDQVSFIRAEKSFDDGKEIYDIEFYYENMEYDYEINAADGQIIESDFDVENYNIQQQQVSGENTDIITPEQAKEIALKHANLTSDQVSFVKAEIDFDNGIQKYDVEFYHGNKEYDYEINATDGKIIGYDYDVEYN